MRWRAHVFQLQHEVAGVMLFAVVKLFEITAHHQAHHRVVIDFPATEFAGVFAIAQHEDAIGQFGDLAEPVRNVNDADALRAQIADDFKECFRFVLRKAAGGLVHNQHARFAGKGLGDFHELLAADGQIAHKRVGGQIKPHAPQMFLGLGVECGVVDEAKFVWLAPEKNIGGEVEVGGEVEFLMNERHALRQCFADGLELHGLAVDENFAGVRRLHAGEDFHERAFARAIFANHCEYFAVAEREARVVQGAHAGESLAQAADLQQRCGRGRHAYCLPSSAIFFLVAQNSSTFSFVTTTNGTSINLFAGMNEVSPSRMSFMAFTDS